MKKKYRVTCKKLNKGTGYVTDEADEVFETDSFDDALAELFAYIRNFPEYKTTFERRKDA